MQKSILVILLAGFTPLMPAETNPHAVGLASAGDSFLVANAPVTSGATIFNGDSVQAGQTSCQVHMKSGSEVTLTPHSEAQFRSSSLTLQTGAAEANLSSGTFVEAEGFVVKPISASVQTRLKVESGNMTIAVLNGQVEVTNLKGAVLSHMVGGSTLNFAYPDSTAGGAAPNTQIHTRVIGVLDEEDEHFLLRDRYSNTVAELIGDISGKYVNRLTMVTGDMEIKDSPIPNVHRIIHVDKIETSNAAAGWPCMPDGVGGAARRLVLHGDLSKDGNRYMMTDQRRGTYEVIGDVDGERVGKNIELETYVLTDGKPAAPAKEVVYAEHRRLVAVDSPCVATMIEGALVTTAVLLFPGNDVPSPRVPVSY
jgi:hypothetical protein